MFSTLIFGSRVSGGYSNCSHIFRSTYYSTRYLYLRAHSSPILWKRYWCYTKLGSQGWSHLAMEGSDEGASHILNHNRWGGADEPLPEESVSAHVPIFVTICLRQITPPLPRVEPDHCLSRQVHYHWSQCGFKVRNSILYNNKDIGNKTCLF